MLGSRDSKENKIGDFSVRICFCYKDHSVFKKSHLVSIQDIPPHKKKNFEVYQKTTFSPIFSYINSLDMETYKSTHNLLETNVYLQ